MNPQSITIVGLGLMGGSLAARCREKFPRSRIVAVTRSRESVRYAKAKKWIHSGTTNLADGVRSTDLVIVCTPVDVLEKTLVQIDAAAHKGTLVTDIGSVKGPVTKWSDKRRFKNIHFVGAHPMVGSHLRGVKAARADLYEQGHTFLMRSKKESLKVHKALGSFWRKITPHVFVMSAREHDQIVAGISHLPHLAAVGLVLGVSQRSLKFASTGFRDTTRIAQGHPSVWGPILKSNKKEILRALKNYEQNLRKVRSVIRKGSDKAMEKMLTTAARKGS